MRNVGLDIARSIAIIMVLISHARFFFVQYTDLQWLSFNGFFGVEIFFVLSGFLIGRIIIKQIVEKPSLSNLLTFYKRRWFRTLPLYFLLVVILILIDKPFHWTNLVFLQNFNFDHLEFFPVSWSLAIEEWFYLLIPMLFLLTFSLLKVNNKGSMFIGMTIFLILLCNALRYLAVVNYNLEWGYGIRNHIFLRMDSILTGVLFAGISIYYKEFYNKLKPLFLYFVSISGLVFCILFYVFALDGGKEIINSSVFGRTFLFSLVSLFFALLIVALEKTKFQNIKFGNIFVFISGTSYSVYLVHHELFMFLFQFNDKSLQWSWLLLAISLVLTYIISYLLYRYYEQPFMKLRDKKIFVRKNNQTVGS